MTWSIDPERISERVFGGPHFRAFEQDGNLMTCLRTGKAWDRIEVARAWEESRNCAPIGEAA